MTCKEIQELILTDDMDGRLSAPQESALEAHLASCTACREFKAQAMQAVSDPFRQSRHFDPLPDTWQKIKERLEQKNSWGYHWEGFLESARDLFKVPRLALAFASVIFVVLFVSFLGKALILKPLAKVQQETFYANNVASYFSFLQSDQEGTDQEEGFGSGIEKYFL